jgi:hypothetical protein
MSLNVDCTLYRKINSKCVTNLNVNAKIREYLGGLGDEFLNKISKPQSMKKAAKLDSIKIKRTCSAKDTVKRKKKKKAKPQGLILKT